MSLSRFFSQNMMKNTKLLFCPDFSFHIWIVRRDVISSSGTKSMSFNLIEISLVSSITYLGVCIIFKLRTCFYKHRNVWLSFFLSLRYRRHLASLQRGRMPTIVFPTWYPSGSRSSWSRHCWMPSLVALVPSGSSTQKWCTKSYKENEDRWEWERFICSGLYVCVMSNRFLSSNWN